MDDSKIRVGIDLNDIRAEIIAHQIAKKIVEIIKG